jgi:5'-nucleotidase
MMGVTSMAVSLDTHREADFSFAARTARRLVRFLAANSLFAGGASMSTCLFFPQEQIRASRWCVREGAGPSRLSRGAWTARQYLLLDVREKAEGAQDIGTDVGALAAGYVTLTPISTT